MHVNPHILFTLMSRVYNLEVMMNVSDFIPVARLIALKDVQP